MSNPANETIDWEKAISRPTGAIPKRPLSKSGLPTRISSDQSDIVSLGTTSSKVTQPQQQKKIFHPWAAQKRAEAERKQKDVPETRPVSSDSTSERRFVPPRRIKPTFHLDKWVPEDDELAKESTSMGNIENIMRTKNRAMVTADYLIEKKQKRYLKEEKQGVKGRAEEDEALAKEFPHLPPEKRRSAKRIFQTKRPQTDRTAELREIREDFVEDLTDTGRKIPQLFEFQYGKPWEAPELPDNYQFMSRFRDPKMKSLMKKYRETDITQKQRSEQIKDYLSRQGMEDDVFYEQFMENVYEPPPTGQKNLRKRLQPGELGGHAWLEKGNVPKPSEQSAKISSARSAKSTEYMTKLKGEQQQRFQVVEEHRTMFYERGAKPVPSAFVFDDEPDMITDQMAMEEKGVSMHSAPRDVMAFAMPEMDDEELLNVSMISEIAPPIFAPDSIPTSQLNAAQMQGLEAKIDVTDLPFESIMDSLLQDDLENLNEIFEKSQRGAAHATESLLSVELELRTPKISNHFQMRGSEFPNWFQGYYVALPGDGNQIKCEKSPSTVMLLAWRRMRPGLLNVI